jgi:hypothetical protein
MTGLQRLRMAASHAVTWSSDAARPLPFRPSPRRDWGAVRNSMDSMRLD